VTTDKESNKTLIAVGGTVLAGLVVTLVWNIFSEGVESKAGKNPAIIAVQVQADKTDEVLAAHLLAVEGRLAGIEAKQGRIIDNQDRMLDALLAQ